MSKIQLLPYQQEAVKFALKVPNCELLMKVGSGKTLCAMFAIRAMLKKRLVDKFVISCTLSSVSVFQSDFKEKANMDIKLADTPEKFIDFLKGDSKVCIIKHSLFKKAGDDLITLKKLKEIHETGLKVGLIIDEAHKLQNTDKGSAQESYHRMHFIFNRTILLTATPYSSCLSQLYGLVCLIYPKLWPSRRAFYDRYIEEITIYNPKTRKPIRKEKIAYNHLNEIREMITPFSYFYFPPVPLVHIEHHARLSNYEDYDSLCKGVLSKEDLDKLEGKKND